MIKVAHITTIDLSLRFLMLNQLRSLVAAGFDVTGISAPGEHTAAVEAAGIRHIAVPMTRKVTPLADLVSLVQLYRVLKAEKFTIVHTHTPKPALLGQLAAHLAGTPIVVNTLHGLTFRDDTPPLKRHLLMLLERICAAMSHFILSQNPEDIETFVKEGIAPRDKLRFLGNGIDITRFDEAKVPESTRARLRGELGILPGEKVVGFVGRFVVEKGILEIAEAMTAVFRELPGARLLVIGPDEGDRFDALRPSDPRFDGIRERTVFAGLRHDMPEMFALMDVFLLPSHREGFPRSPMEAAAMRRPAIVTDVTGCRETVQDGYNGFLVPKGDAGALAARTLELLRDPELARRMGDNGRRLAEDRFDERKVFAVVADTYRELLAQRPATRPAPRASLWGRFARA